MFALTLGNAIRAAAYAAIISVVAFAGVQTVRLNSAQAANDKLRLEVAGMKLAVDLSEQLRGQEQAQASTSYADLSSRCEQRVDQARKAQSIIEGITNGTFTHPSVPAASVNPGATRALVPAGELRGIVGQPATR